MAVGGDRGELPDERAWQRPIERRLKMLLVVGAAAGLVSYSKTHNVDLATLRGIGLPALAMFEMGLKGIRTGFLPARGGPLRGWSAVLLGVLAVLASGVLIAVSVVSWI